ALERFELAGVVERRRRDSRDSRQQLQMIFVESLVRIPGVEIDHAQRLIIKPERRAKQRLCLRNEQAFDVAQSFTLRNVNAEHGPAALHNAIDHCAAHTDRAFPRSLSPEPDEWLSLNKAIFRQDYGARLRRYYLKYQFHQPPLQLSQFAN